MVTKSQEPPSNLPLSRELPLGDPRDSPPRGLPAAGREETSAAVVFEVKTASSTV